MVSDFVCFVFVCLLLLSLLFCFVVAVVFCFFALNRLTFYSPISLSSNNFNYFWNTSISTGKTLFQLGLKSSAKAIISPRGKVK